MSDQSQPRIRTPEEMEHFEWKVSLAVELMRLGVSETVTEELLTYPPELLERQLRYFPYRKAKKPVSLLVASIKNDYEKPAKYPDEEADAA